MPQPELLGEVAGVPLGRLLTALNRKLEAILGKRFVQSETIKVGTGDSADERTVYRVRAIADDGAFVQALTELAAA